MAFARPAEGLKHGEWFGTLGHGECPRHRLHQIGIGPREMHIAIVRREERVEKTEMPSEVADGDDRQPPASQRAVGVVPLRPLGVEPDATAWHEVRELHERGHEQLLGQGGEPRHAVGVRDRRPVGPDLRHPLP